MEFALKYSSKKRNILQMFKFIAMRKIQINATLSFHLTTVRKAKIKNKSKDNKF